MFAPAATLALQTKPVQQPQRTTQPTNDLVIALAKLTLQHEQERQNRAPSENVVLQASASHPMMQRLEALVEMYDQEEKTARANHTQGKRPDALFRGVLYRLAENVRENQQVVEQRLLTEKMVAAALNGYSRWENKQCRTETGRLFVASESNPRTKLGRDIVWWIFAPSRQRQLTEDLWTLREAKTLEPLQVHLRGQTSATTGLWDSTHQHKEPEENPQTEGPDRGRGRRGGLITHYFVRRGGT